DMLPFTSTAWLGRVMKFPGRTPASAGMNSPPELASKMVTLRISPMPIRRVRGRPPFVKPVSRGMALANTSVTFRGDPDERVGKALGVALARQHVHAQRARGRQDAAAAQCERTQ